MTKSLDRNMSTKSEVGKYLTEIKELPPELDAETKPNPIAQTKMRTRPVAAVPAPKSASEKLPVEKKESDAEQKVPIVESFESDEENLRRLPFSTKDIILGIINLASVILLIIILVKFPSKGKELNSLRVENIKSEQNITFELEEVESQKKMAQRLEDLFLDDAGVVNFVNDVEKIKAEGGSVTGVSFANPVALKDRTGNIGVPVVIQLVGSWEQIGKDIQRIDVLPYLFRPVRVQAEPAKDAEGVIVYKYGVFLYVREVSKSR